MSQLNALKKIIREEVRAVFQEELAGILKEAIIANKSAQSLTETTRPIKSQIPGTLNRAAPRPIAPILGPNNPLNSLLAQTAQSMTFDDLDGFGSETGAIKDAPIVESVDQMFAASRGSSNLEAIQINAVPDFTGLMAKMKENGQI